MKKLIEEALTTKYLTQRLLNAALFSVVFMVLGRLIPDTYFRYFDKTVYYSVEQPISMDRKFYTPCEVTKATIRRKSLVETTASSVVDLILVRADDTQEKITNIDRSMAITKGERVITVDWPLPCNVPSGTYYWQAVMKFTVNGIEKTYSYYTETFSVTWQDVLATDQ